MDVDTDREEERAKVITLFEESFQDKIAFWNNMLHFGSDGILYDLTEPQNEDTQYQMYYFISDDWSITAISSDNTIYSADFQIEDDTLVLTISDLEGDFEVYASLEKEKLPPVKKAAIKCSFVRLNIVGE
ncbi:hypothetical protein [Dysgonomonas sp. Marseille-P4361]|uniref:hypothetical protein n=1 Tax=Dysgonomonas sp. Marseille-P4361 TaxID=2161820 RepID=UPI000D553F64|nr:hypothetical protein [Dysgonomonas sp. Marseille-P4361]